MAIEWQPDGRYGDTEVINLCGGRIRLSVSSSVVRGEGINANVSMSCELKQKPTKEESKKALVVFTKHLLEKALDELKEAVPNA